MRRIALLLGVVAAVAAAVFGVRAYQARDVALSESQMRDWSHLVTDIDHRCVPPAKRPAEQVAHDRAIDTDVAALIDLAQANPHAWFPSYDDDTFKGERVSWELTQTGNSLECGRADLVGRLWDVARSLPGGWAPSMSAADHAQFMEAWADLQIRCSRAAHGTKDPNHVNQDVTTMIRLNRSNTPARLFRHIALGPALSTDRPDYNLGPHLGRCGDPAAINRLATANRIFEHLIRTGAASPSGSGT